MHLKNSTPASVDEIISRHIGKPGALLCILKELQEQTRYNYLKKEILEYIAGKLKISISKIYSVITFYTFFNLEPQGEHSVIVCRGTACHTRGSKNILNYLKTLLQVQNVSGEENQPVTTSDKKFTIKSVACFGQCALAPVVSIDGIIHSHVTTEKVKRIIKKYSVTRTKKHKK